MTSRRSVSVIQPTLSDTDAVAEVAELVGNAAARLECVVHYPYRRFVVAGSAPSWFGRRPVSTVCLVDTQNGTASTADAFSLQQMDIDVSALLPSRVTAANALRAARSYTSHALGRAFRSIANFGLDCRDSGLVYRRFCIVQAGGHRIMVDSVSGGVHTL